MTERTETLVDEDRTYWPLPVAQVERAERAGWGIHHKVATIATTLRQDAESSVSERTILRVVGNDLPNVADPLYTWSKNCLPDWLQRGVEVRYFALNPSEQAVQNLALLSENGNLKAKRLAGIEKLDETAKRCSAQWKTFHFAVFENSPQLWVEMSHRPDQKTASDCYYFGPEHAEKLFLYEDCKSDFDHMFDNFGSDLV